MVSTISLFISISCAVSCDDSCNDVEIFKYLDINVIKDLLFYVIEIAEGEWKFEDFARFGNCIESKLVGHFGSVESFISYATFRDSQRRDLE